MDSLWRSSFNFPLTLMGKTMSNRQDVVYCSKTNNLLPFLDQYPLDSVTGWTGPSWGIFTQIVSWRNQCGCASAVLISDPSSGYEELISEYGLHSRQANQSRNEALIKYMVSAFHCIKINSRITWLALCTNKILKPGPFLFVSCWRQQEGRVRYCENKIACW